MVPLLCEHGWRDHRDELHLSTEPVTEDTVLPHFARPAVIHQVVLSTGQLERYLAQSRGG